MKRAFLIGCLALASLGNIYGTDDQWSTRPYLQFSMQPDGRKWDVGYEVHTDDQKLVEYVVNGENVNNWTELFTVQAVDNAPVDPAAYFPVFIEELQKMVPGSKVQSRVISSDDNSLLGEWWIDDKTSKAQHEWIRVFVEGDQLRVARYTMKNLADVEKRRKSVEEILKNTKMVSGKSEVSNVDVQKPTITEPNVTKPVMQKPTVQEVNVTEPKVTESPKVVEPKITKPNMQQPSVPPVGPGK